MNLPVSYRLPVRIHTQGVLNEWLHRTGVFPRCTYDWNYNILTFEDEQDAMAFQITFGIDRYETTVERMIKNADCQN